MARIYIRGKVWYLDFRVNGKRHRKRVGTPKKVAELALQDLQVKLERQEFGFAGKEVAIDKFLDQFLEYSRTNHQPTTTKRYKAVIDHFRAFMEEEKSKARYPSHLSPETFDRYKVYRKNAWVNPNGGAVNSEDEVEEYTRKGARSHTSYFELAALRTILNLAVKWGYLRENPTKGVKKLKVPKKQPKRGRLWFNDGSCVRQRAEYRNHLWSYDFVYERTQDNRPLRILTIVDEFTRECLALKTGRRLTAEDVVHALADLFVARGAPVYLRSDNGPEFTAKAVRQWLERLQVQTLFIEPGYPWENGYVESFNGKLRDELLDREIFYTMTEAEVLLERWRVHYNTKRPHSSLGYRPPAPEAVEVSSSLTKTAGLLS